MTEQPCNACSQRPGRTALHKRLKLPLCCAPHSGHLHSSPAVYFCLASVLNCFCALTCYAVPEDKLCACFHSFCLYETFLLSKEVRARETLPLAPGGLAARIPGLYLGYPVQLLGRELRSHFRTVHCYLSEIICSSGASDLKASGTSTSFLE